MLRGSKGYAIIGGSFFLGQGRVGLFSGDAFRDREDSTCVHLSSSGVILKVFEVKSDGRGG